MHTHIHYYINHLHSEPLDYEATILVSPTSSGQDVDISIIPPDSVASETTIQEYRLRITGGDGVNVEVVNVSAQMRYVIAWEIKLWYVFTYDCIEI